MRTRGFIVIALAVCVSPAGAGAQTSQTRQPVPKPNALPAEIDGWANAAVKAGGHAFAIAVLKPGQPPYLRGFSADGNVTPSTRFRLGSVTKQFTAGVIVQLFREHKLAPTDTLDKWIPEVPEAWRPVTVRQLLAHTSGIPNYTALPLFGLFMNRDVTPDGIWQFAANPPKLDFPPGTKFNYTNTGFAILGAIIERVEHRAFFKVLHDRILGPLGMTQTGEERDAPVIEGFDEKGRPPVKINMTWPYSAGALVSTVTDLAKWDTALRTGALFTDAERTLMFTPDPETVRVGSPYNFGLVPRLRNGRTYSVEHGGSIPGFNTYIIHSLLHGTSVIVLNNADGNGAQTLAQRIVKRIEPDWDDAPAAVVPDPKPEITKRHEQFFRTVLAGTFNAAKFDDALLAAIPVPKLKEVAAQLNGLGSLSEFRFVGGTDQARRYHIQLGETGFTLSLTETDAGKVSGMLVHPG